MTCIRNYSNDLSKFEDASIPQGLLNTLMQNAFYDCGVPLLPLPLLRYAALEECQIDNGWVEKIDIDTLDFSDASPRSLDYLAELFDYRFLHIINHEKDVQHWEHYCKAGVILANHALSHHRGNVDLDDFEQMIISLTYCAEKGNKCKQLQFSDSKIFQSILKELLTVVTSEACRRYLDLEVEIRVREALVNAGMLPNPQAQKHFSKLIPLLEKLPIRDACNENLAKTIFSYSSDFEISLRAARLFCFDPKSIELINRIGQLYQTSAVDQKILEIAAFMSTHTKSMEKIPWPRAHAWWDEMENHVSDGQKNCLKILRQILVGKGERGCSKLVWRAAHLCLVTFFGIGKDWRNPELLKEVFYQLQDEKDNCKYAFVHALAPLFFWEAANIIYSDEHSGETYGDVLRCICLAGGLKESEEAFAFAYRLFKLAEQQAFGELCFVMFRALDKGNVLLPRDPVKASQYLNKSRKYCYKPATLVASASGTLLASSTPRRQQHDFLRPEENPTQLFCKQMKKILAPLWKRDQNRYDLSRFSEIIEDMTLLFLQRDSLLDRQDVLDDMERSHISPLIAKIFDRAFSKENTPEVWNCRLLLGVVNWHLRPDIREEGSGIDLLRNVAENAPINTGGLAKNRAIIFLSNYCDQNFERAKELFNGDTVKEEALAALYYALAACFGGYKGDQEAIKKAFKAKVTVSTLLVPKKEDEKRQLVDAHMALAMVYLKESFGISRDMRKVAYHFEKILAHTSHQIRAKRLGFRQQRKRGDGIRKI